jgi:parallel beta-helix repeat protein
MATILGGILSSRAAIAATYYVATTGSDSNPGTQSQPFRTIGKCTSVMGAGDTLYIRSGTYPGINAITMTIPSGTNWSNAPVIAAYPGETVIVGAIGMHNVRYVIFDGLIADAGDVSGEALYIDAGADHIRVQNGVLKNARIQGVQITRNSGGFNELINLEIHNNGHDPNFEHGVYIWSSNNLVQGCSIHDNAAYGVHIYEGGGGINNNRIIGNRIFNNGSSSGDSTGLVLSSGDGNIAYNNVIYNNRAGIGISRATNTKVYNNTVYNNPGGYAGIEIYQSSGTIVRNNIVSVPGTIRDQGINTTLSNNLTTDPKYVNSSANDFHLQSTSPAINAGITLTEVPIDFDGNPRPQGVGSDIGAYEYQSTPLKVLPSPTNLRAVSVSP